MHNPQYPTPSKHTIYSTKVLQKVFLETRRRFKKSVKNYIANPHTSTPILLLDRRIFQNQHVGIHNQNHPQNEIWQLFCTLHLKSVMINGRKTPIINLQEKAIYNHPEHEHKTPSVGEWAKLPDGTPLFSTQNYNESWHTVQHSQNLHEETAVGLTYGINLKMAITQADVNQFEKILLDVEQKLIDQQKKPLNTIVRLCLPYNFYKAGKILLPDRAQLFFYAAAWQRFQSSIKERWGLFTEIKYGYIEPESSTFMPAVIGDKYTNKPMKDNYFGYYLIVCS